MDKLHQCQYAGCGIYCTRVLHNVMVEETGQGVQGSALYYFLQLHMNLQLSQ